MCVFWLYPSAFPSSLFSGLPIPRHNIAIRPNSNCPVAFKCLSDRRVTPPTLSQNLEMKQLSDEACWKPGQAKSWASCAKKVAKLWMQILEGKRKCYSSEAVNGKKAEEYYFDTGNVSLIWRDQPSHSIPLSQSPIQSKALSSSILWRLRGEEASEERFETSRGWFMTLREGSRLCNRTAQGEAAGADGEAAAQITKGAAAPNNRFSLEMKVSCWKKMPPRTFHS